MNGQIDIEGLVADISLDPGDSQSITIGLRRREATAGDQDSLLVSAQSISDPAVVATHEMDLSLAERFSPTANAGDDQRVNEGQSVTLDGSTSSDSDGVIVSYSWSQIAGMSVSLSALSGPSISFVAPDVSAGQVLQFELTTIDDDGLSDSDVVIVTVNNTPPPPRESGGGGSSTIELLLLLSVLTMYRYRKRRMTATSCAGPCW